MMKISGVLVLALALSACVKKPGEKVKTREDFGPEISAGTLDTEFRLMPSPNVWGIRTGDEALVAHKQYIENNRAQIVSTTQTVTNKRVETAEEITFGWRLRLQEYDNEGRPKPDPSGKEFEETLKKPAASALLRALETILKPFTFKFSFIAESTANVPTLRLQSSPRMVSMQLQAAATEVSYHNFVRVPIDMEIPSLAKARPNCGGRDPEFCNKPIKGQKLAFDAVYWEEGKPPRKISQLIVTSADLPFFIHEGYQGPSLTSFYMNCYEGMIDIQNQKVHLIDCQELSDLSFGPITP